MPNTGNTQQQINYGAAVNDGTGDPLRTAFVKTDDNFDAVWLAGPVGSNITIVNNTVQVNNTNGNLILMPNGIGVIQTNSKLLPSINNAYDLGSTTLKYRAGYFGAGGLVVDGNVTVTGNLTAGNISYTGNVFVGDLQGSVYADDSTIMVDAIDNELFAGRATISGNVSAAYFVGNGSLLTGIVSSYGNANVVTLLSGFGSNTVSTTGNITANYFVGNGSQLTGITSYANANAIALGESGWIGNIIPSGNAIYSLGNATNQWNDLYVSNATIFMNNVPIGLSAGNVLTVNGNAVLQNNSNSTISTTGDITANIFIGDGSQLTNLPSSTGDLTFVNTTISAPNDEDIDIQTLKDDGTAGSEIVLRPGDALMRLRQWSEQDDQSFDTTDWATGVYTSQGVPPSVGVIEFSGAGNIINFVDSLEGTGQIFFSVNGGPLMASEGTAGGGSSIAFYVADMPAVDPTTVTTFEYYYSYYSQIEIDYDDEEFNIEANNVDVTISTTGQTDIAIDSSRDIDIQGNGEYRLINGSPTDPIQIITDATDSNYTWSFDETGNLTLPADGFLRVTSGIVGTGASPAPTLSGFSSISAITISASGNITGGNIITAGIVNATGNVNGDYFIGNGSQLTGIAASYGNANVATFLAEYGSNTISTTGNITGGNLIASTTVYGNVDVVLGNTANASATKTRIVGDTTFSYIQTGNGTVGSTGNIVFSPYSATTQRVVIDTASGNVTAAGNVTAQNFTGNISITGNVTGTSANVDLVAGSNTWSFNNTGNLVLPGNTFAVNYANGTAVDVVTRFEGSWNVATGNTTQSFTVDGGHTYQMWVQGNIPNGIIVWNATVSVSNTNVPVIGQQFAWNYEGGGSPILLTSIPAQIIGTAGAISNASPAVANTNVFTFGINNTSGSNQTVQYGWIQIS